MQASSTLFLFCLVLSAIRFGYAGDSAIAQASPGKPDVAADINKPRADARKVSFQTTTSTWSSVDVSPDGRTLVFDLLGDIYTLPIAGGEAKPVSTGPAFDSHPRYSPDGRTIAFTSDRGGIDNIWLMDADGSNPRPVTAEKDAYVSGAAWTPEGNYLVARKEDAKRAGIEPDELWIYHREGGGGIKLTSSDDFAYTGGAVVSRDGRYVYFSARARKFNYVPDLTDGLWKILRFDRSNSETRLIASGFGGAARPVISPDGKTLVYVSRRDDDSVLIARNLESGAERILVRPVTRDAQEGFAKMDVWPNYAFTPDGNALVYSNHGKLSLTEVASGATREIPFTAHVDQYLAPRVAWQDKVEQGPVKARILRWPIRSPNGKFIAFEAFGRVWLQELSNGKAAAAPRRLTADNARLPKREYAPDISPERRRRRPGLEGAGLAGLGTDAAHGASGALCQSGMVAGRRADRSDHGIRSGISRAPAGGRYLLHARRAGRHRRQTAHRDGCEIAAGSHVSSATLLERGWRSALLWRARRGQETLRRPQDGSCLDTPRGHGSQAPPALSGRR